MSETIPRLYLSVYETNKKLGKILIAVFLIVYVVPFVVSEISYSVISTDAATAYMPKRIQGVLNTQMLGDQFAARKANPNFVPMSENRPLRIIGVCCRYG